MKLSRSVSAANYIDPKLISLHNPKDVKVDNINIVHARAEKGTHWKEFVCAAVITDLLKDEGFVFPKGCSIRFIPQRSGDWLLCVDDTDAISSAYALLTSGTMKTLIDQVSEHVN